MKRVLILFLVLVFSIQVFPQTAKTFDLSRYGVTIQPDRRVIVVLAALEAAGVKTPLAEKGEEFRRQLEIDQAGISETLRMRMTSFITQYRKRNLNLTDAQLVAPFISMAYALSPVPELMEPSRNSDLPGDLLDVLDFSPLIREFYRNSQFSFRIEEYVKAYQKAGDELRPSTSVMIGQLLDYLKTRPDLYYVEKTKTKAQSTKGTKRKIERIETRERERRFFIVPELLAPKGTINFVNVGDEYFAVAPPSTDMTTSEVRRAYLQFVLDPIVLKNSESIFAQRTVIKSLLDERRKVNPSISPDFVLAISRSLVAAVDARQIEYDRSRIATYEAREKIQKLEAEDQKLKAEGKFDMAKRDDLKRAIVKTLNDYNQTLADESAVLLSDAYESGAVLAFHFADKLKTIEDSGFDLTESVSGMIASFDSAKETDRLAQVSESRTRGKAEREKRKTLAANQPVVAENPLVTRLYAIDAEINGGNYDSGRTSLKDLLASDLVLQNPEEKARIYYALGRLESLSAESAGNIEERNVNLVAAQQAYSKVIEFQVKPTDPRVLNNKLKATEPALISLTFVALGRIYEFNEQNEYALKLYDAAINLGNISGSGYGQAVASKTRLLKGQ